MPVRLGPRDPVEVSLKLTRRDPSTALGDDGELLPRFCSVSQLLGVGQSIDIFDRLVAPNCFDSGKTQGESAGVARAWLNGIEGNFQMMSGLTSR